MPLTIEEVIRIARGLSKVELDGGAGFVAGFVAAVALVEVPLQQTANSPQHAAPATRRRRNWRVKRKPEPASAPANGAPRAVSFLRGALSRGPAVASHIEDLAIRRGIGRAELDAAKATLGVRVERHSNGVGVVYLLPKHQGQDGAEAKSSGVLL